MRKHLFFFSLLLATLQVAAQTVGIGTNTPASSALLDVSSTDKGFLMPRLTTAQRDAIVSPATGLMIFNLVDNSTDTWNGSEWVSHLGTVSTVNNLPGTWTQKASLTGVERLRAVGFSIGTKAYLGTGLETNVGPLKDFWEYDPALDTWTQKADFAGAARWSAIGFAINEKGYIGLGSTNFSNINLDHVKDFWEYDPATNQWIQKQDFGGTARAAATGVGLGNKGYVGLGHAGTIDMADFWEYDPANNKWTEKQGFAGGTRRLATGISIADKLFVGLGNSGGVNFKDWWQYDPLADQWTQKQNFGGVARNGQMGFSIGDNGFVGGGFNGGYLKDFWQYNAASNQWIKKADIGGSLRSAGVGFSVGNKGYLATGNNNGVFQKELWEYNPQVSVSPTPAIANAAQYTDAAWTKLDNSVYQTNLAGYVAIGTTTPGSKLSVIGTSKATGFQLTTGAGNGKVLRSDEKGRATWVTPANISASASGPAGGVLTGSYPNPTLTNTGITAGTYTKLTIDAKGRATGGSNINNTDITPLETDPQVGSNTSNYLSKWSGSALVSSGVVDNGTSVGIGEPAPVKKLEVSGTGGLRVNSTNAGAGSTDWIAGNFGGTAGSRVVMGLLNGTASIGAHNNNLAVWNNLVFNPDGGSVGIGTATPVNKLDVAGTGGMLVNSSNTGGGGSDWIAGNFGGTAGNRVVMGLLNGTATIGAQNNALSAWAPLSLGPAENFSVGIGTTNPIANSMLDVAGTVKLGIYGSSINNIIRLPIDVGPIGVPANGSTTLTISGFTSLVTNSVVQVSPSVPLPTGVVISYALISAPGVAKVIFTNQSPNAVNTPSCTLHLTVFN